MTVAKARVSLRQDLASRIIKAASDEGVNYQLVLERAVSEYLANGIKDWALAHRRISELEDEAARYRMQVEADRLAMEHAALLLASSHIDGCGCAFCSMARVLDPHLPSQMERQRKRAPA